MFDSELVKDKVNQAIQILKEKEVDAWLTFVRETSQLKDPCMDLIGRHRSGVALGLHHHVQGRPHCHRRAL